MTEQLNQTELIQAKYFLINTQVKETESGCSFPSMINTHMSSVSRKTKLMIHPKRGFKIIYSKLMK